MEPLDSENSFRFLRIVETAEVWTRLFQGVGRDEIKNKDVREHLDGVVDAGGMWELSPSGLLVQMIRQPDDSEVPEQLRSLDRVLDSRDQG